MKHNRPNGIALAFAGEFIAGLGFLVLDLQGISQCSPVQGTGIICTVGRGIGPLTYYLAVAGSALLVVGTWQAGLGRKKIVYEGAWLVASIGSIVLAFGFLLSSFLPYPSVSSAEVGYSFGLLGSGLLMGGMVKITAGKETVSLSSPTMRDKPTRG